MLVECVHNQDNEIKDNWRIYCTLKEESLFYTDCRTCPLRESREEC